MKVWLPTIRTSSGTDVFAERLASALSSAGIEVELTWLPHAFELLPSLHGLVRTPRGCDVIHANSWTAHALMRRSLPMVVTVHHLVHDPEYAPYRTVKQAFYHRAHVYPGERRAIERAECVTAVSHYVAATVSTCMGRSDVHVIPNWVDTQRFRPVDTTCAEGSPRRFRLLCVANSSRRKGSDLLLPLINRLGTGFELRVTGGLRGGKSGNDRSDGVVSLGRLSDDELLREFMQCDAVVSVSRYEGFGYSALEGMACGKPVAAFAAGGLREVVVDGVTGFTVGVGDLDGLADRIRQLAASPTLQSAMGAAGRARALRLQDAWRAYIPAYRAAIERRNVRRDRTTA